MRLAAGEVLDARYRVDGLIGEGGFAQVYRATDVGSGRVVALKVLSEDLLDSERSRARFEREIEIVARLQSPHTVKLFGRGTTPDGAPYIVFEYVAGRDLRDVLNDETALPEPVVRHIMRQVLLALTEAHRAGVVHRDLKPANVHVYTWDGDPWRAKVLDFGVALATTDAGPRLTGANELVGTPRYMSPEQLLGEECGPASDIYALGIMSWELLTGAESLHGARWGDQLARLQSGFHLASPDDGSDFGGLAEVIHKMTARDVTQRFGSAEAVLRALDEGTRVEPPAATTVVELAVPEREDEPKNWLPIAVAVAAAIFVIAAVLVFRPSNEPPPERSLPAVLTSP